MSDEYQLRKDIDELIQSVQRLETNFNNTLTEDDIDDFTTSLDSLETDLDNFQYDLSKYKNKLEEFNGELTGEDGFASQLQTFSNQLNGEDGFASQLQTFSGQLNGENGFASQLQTFSGQLNGENGFASQLQTLSGQLNGENGFASQLQTLDGQLNGENGFARQLQTFSNQLNGANGFTSKLTALQHWIYGEGDTYTDEHGVEQDYDYSHPSPSSLKGMLNDFSSQLTNLISGDQKLLLDLNNLKGFLTGFTGTLQDFKDELEEADIDTTELDDGLLKLFYAINTTIDGVSEHETEVQKFNDWLGDPSDSASTQGNSPTMFGVLNDTSDAVGDENSGLIKATNDMDFTLNGDANNQGLVDLTNDIDFTVNGDATHDGLVDTTSALDFTVNGDATHDGLVDTTSALDFTVNGDATHDGLVDLTNDINITVNGDANTQGLVDKAEAIDLTLNGDANTTGLIEMTGEVITKVGNPATGNQASTGLFASIDGVDGKAENIKSKIGYNSIGNTNLQDQITAQGGTITGIQGDIGTVPSGQTLQGQISTHTTQIGSVPSGSTLQGQITSNTGDISDIQGDIGTVPSGKTLQGQITTIEDNAPIIIYDFEIANLQDPSVGDMAVNNKTVWKVGERVTVSFKVMKNNTQYHPTSTEFPIYVYTPSGQTSTVYKNTRFTHQELYSYQISESGLHLIVFNGNTYPINVEHSHSTWTDKTSDINSTYVTSFEVNTDLKMCTLKYYRSGYSFSNTSEVTLHTGLIPSTYRPSVSVVGDVYNQTVGIMITASGNIDAYTTASGSKTINANFMWHY